MIKVENLEAGFDGVKVLDQLNLSFAEGEIAAIIGPSGAGKSTFLRCLNFLAVPTSGKITIDGCTVDAGTVTGQEIYALRRKTAMVFQQYHLLKNKTALQNVLEPMLTVQKMPKAEAVEIAERLLAQAGMLEKKDAYPKELSGGQQQRVGIARALAVNTRVILFDEPTSSLDPELVGEVLTMIRQLALEHKKTLLIVTHEMKFAREVADRIIFLDGGRIVADGTPQEIFETCENPRVKKFIQRIETRSAVEAAEAVWRKETADDI